MGSEVVLIAGVCGPDGYLRTNRRLEWSIDPGSVGQFLAVGETGLVDVLLGDFNRPRKITNTFAIGSTLRANTATQSRRLQARRFRLCAPRRGLDHADLRH